MKMSVWFGVVAMGFLITACQPENNSPPESNPPVSARSFDTKGIVRELRPADQTVVIKHEAITNFMPAMTMPFQVKRTNELLGLSVGDEISFRLMVADEDSWIEQITKTGKRAEPPNPANLQSPGAGQTGSSNQYPLLDYQFTNQMGQAVTLNQFKGQALAITFIFTRCPIPEYCPRLSKNFAEASRTLRALPKAPTNWHFLSVTFDPAFDTPEVLKAYAQTYQYDPNHWSFLTGAADQLAEFAQTADITARPDGNFYDHNFRTLIINAQGKLQMSFPISGNLTEAIVTEMLKAATVPNQ